MKNSPGTSLFQNTIFQNGYVDNVAREELEAEQDKIRLQKELDDEIQKAFGDGDFSDTEVTGSYSASGSGNYTNSHSISEHPERTNAAKDTHRRTHNKDYSDTERLNVLYSVRLRENDQLRSEIERLKKESEVEKSELTSLLKQTQNQLDKMTESHDGLRTLLGQTTKKLNDTEYELTSLKKRLSESEELKQTALHELEMCKATTREQEKRLLVAETNTYKSDEANFDRVLKELTSNHKKEVYSMQKTIDNLNSKLSSSEKNCVRLEQQLLDEKRMNSEKIATLKEYPSRYENEIEVLKTENATLKSENEALKFQLSKAKQDQDVLRTTLMDHVTKSDTLHQEELRNAMTNQRNEIESLNSAMASARAEIESLKAELASTKRDEDELRQKLMDYLTKADIQHKEEISELELIYSKKVLSLEAKLREVEDNTKEDVYKVFTEEVDRISTTFVGHFDVLNETVEKLKNELQTKMQQAAQTSETIEKLRSDLEKANQKYANDVTQSNETIEKLRSEMEKVDQKYANARKSAIALKEQAETRKQVLHRRHSEFCETLKKIAKYLDGGDTKKLNTIVKDSLIAHEKILRSELSTHGAAIPD